MKYLQKHAQFFFFFWAAFVLTLVSWPMPDFQGTEEKIYDKIVHVILFGVFTFLFLNLASLKCDKPRRYFGAFVVGTLYAAIGEFIQRFVPGRDVSEKDLIAGVIGVVLAIIIYIVIPENFYKRSKWKFIGNPGLNRTTVNYNQMTKQHIYYVYILASSRNGTLYIGVTNNLFSRAFQHKLKENKDSFTAKYNINKLVYYEEYKYIQEAIKREKQLKKWNRKWKIELIEKENPAWRDLFLDMV